MKKEEEVLKMNLKKRSLIFVTFFLSCLAIALLGASLGTKVGILILIIFFIFILFNKSTSCSYHIFVSLGSDPHVSEQSTQRSPTAASLLDFLNIRWGNKADFNICFVILKTKMFQHFLTVSVHPQLWIGGQGGKPWDAGHSVQGSNHSIIFYKVAIIQSALLLAFTCVCAVLYDDC